MTRKQKQPQYLLPYVDLQDPHNPEQVQWRYYPDGSVWPYETKRDRIHTTIGITFDRLIVIEALFRMGEIFFGVPGAPEPLGILHADATSVPLDHDKGKEMAERFTARVRELLASDPPEPITIFGLPVVENPDLAPTIDITIGSWCQRNRWCAKADGHDGDCVALQSKGAGEQG